MKEMNRQQVIIALSARMAYWISDCKTVQEYTGYLTRYLSMVDMEELKNFRQFVNLTPVESEVDWSRQEYSFSEEQRAVLIREVSARMAYWLMAQKHELQRRAYFIQHLPFLDDTELAVWRNRVDLIPMLESEEDR